MRIVGIALLTALMLLINPAGAEGGHRHHGAHVHGIAVLEVAVDGGILAIHLESPLDSLVGFEHAPKTDAQRARAKATLAALKQGDRLFTPTPDAHCVLAGTTIEAPVLEGHDTKDNHGDLDADYRFECANPDKLNGLDTRLFEQFGSLSRIDAAVVTHKGQQAYRLTKRLHFMALR